MEKPVYLITGANGQLGKCIRDISTAYTNAVFYFLSRDEMPVEDFTSVDRTIHAINPTCIINAAAYTAVDKAETERDIAFRVNAHAPAHLASICRQRGVKFLHVSTDYVFNGDANRPYVETDEVKPINVYGASKLKGEELVTEANGNSIIIRTSWVYSRHGNNFVKTMLRLMKERNSLNVVNDQVGCPTYAIDLAEALLYIAQKPHPPGGIYHFSNTGPISWFEFATAIKKMAGLQCVVNPIPGSAYPTPAKRPHYSVLDNSRICNMFGIKQKDWSHSLKLCLDLLNEQHA